MFADLLVFRQDVCVSIFHRLRCKDFLICALMCLALNCLVYESSCNFVFGAVNFS